jgi:D-beta-D-heptose 7-phosphate kinase/D-beta-D-heptose 1-phosphate adenosyltransferase
MFLQGAHQEGDILIIALESDDFIQKEKNRSPVHTQEQRATVLSALTFVDYVIPLPYIEDSAQYSHLVQSLNPTIIAVTEGDEKIHLKRGHAAQVGAEVKVVCPPLTDFSTTKIIEYANLFSD